MSVVYGDVNTIIQNSGVTTDELGYASDEVYGVAVTSLLIKASRLIDQYCGVPAGYFNGGVNITEIVDGHSYESIINYDYSERRCYTALDRCIYNLTYTPIISITSVSKNTANIGEAETWETITSYSLNKNNGKLVFKLGSEPEEGVNNVKFVYKAGYTTTPSEIVAAAEEIVINALQKMNINQLNAKIRFGRPVKLENQPTIQLTPDIKQMIEPYKRRNF